MTTTQIPPPPNLSHHHAPTRIPVPSPSHDGHPGRIKRRQLVFATLLIAAVPLAFVVWHWWPRTVADDGHVRVSVHRATLPIVITAGGELESGKSIDVFCEIEGNTKIVEMVPEGTHVTDQQVVMRLDPSSVNDRLAQQRIRVTQANALAKAAAETLKIQQNLADSKVADAELALTLAELDQKKYIEGDYGVIMNDLKGSIALAESDLQDAADMLEFYRDLVKKGFRTPEQLRAKEQSLKRAEYLLNRDREKLLVLEEFTRERQTTELKAKAEEAKRELERAKSSRAATVVKARTDFEVAEATASLEAEQLEKLTRQLTACEVKAPKAGILVYANIDKARVELGATVHFKQKLFSIPDMTEMQVRAWIHESVVKKIQPGLQSEISVEAYPNLVFRGEVIRIANFYDSTRHWMSGGVKEYAATIRIHDLPDIELKPGMTAQSSIKIEEIADALIVPLEAVVPYQGEYACYVAGPSGPKRRTVVIGESNENFVQILEGVKAGDVLALDARARVAKELEVSKQSAAAATEDAKPSETPVTQAAKKQ